MKNLKEQKGITLVALVITIIILLILSGISIGAVINTNLLGSANKAKLESKRSQISEFLKLKLLELQAYNYDKTDQEILELARKNIEESNELKKFGKEINVDGKITTKETEEPYFNIIIDNDMYEFSIKEQTFIGEADKIKPELDFNYTRELTSITLKITTKRAKGAKVECYIKGENDSDYGEARTVENNQYIFENIEQGVDYMVKVVVISENGEKAEKEEEIKATEIVLFENGITNDKIGGGFTKRCGSGVFTYGNPMRIKRTTNEGQWEYDAISSNSTIDVTRYSNLYITCSSISLKSSNIRNPQISAARFGVLNSNSSGDNGFLDWATFTEIATPEDRDSIYSETDITYKVDISNIIGNKYIGFGDVGAMTRAQTMDISITKIWMD